MQNLSFQHILLGIFAVANNLPALGLFLSICNGLSPVKQQRLCNIATLTALITMLVAMLTGQMILEFFGISINAFRIAGGLLLCTSGMQMLHSNPDNNSNNTSSSKVRQHFSQLIPIAIVPIGIPLTTGAGTVSTITIFAEQIHHNQNSMWKLFIAILVMTAIIYFTFKYSTLLLKTLGSTGMNVLIKITGLFTLAIGIQFIVDGAQGVFPILASH
jgi:multiple antibiotic resistance protein